MEVTSKFQTIFTAEEEHLTAMSSSSITSTKISSSTTRKLTKKSTLKSMSSTQSSEELQLIQDHEGLEVIAQPEKKLKTLGKKKQQQQQQENSTTLTEKAINMEQIVEGKLTNGNNNGTTTTTELTNGKKKLKSKKSKKGERDQQTISVKSSLTKFDALQKRNLIHNPQGEKEINCRLCSKPVYKMEEIKAEKSIFHKNCFRCHECNKPLKVDNYQSHEGVLYCLVHFKLLFAPKCVESDEAEQLRKPELIIRENQPTELPPDVVRASDRPNLGLEELQQLNVRSRFQVFENSARAETRRNDEPPPPSARSPVRHGAKILSKLAKLQSQGVSTDLSNKTLVTHIDHAVAASNGDESDNDNDSDNDSGTHDDSDGADTDLVRSKRRTKKERPAGLGAAMQDIKTRFEKGHMLSKEERREERKQEIQNIRSRLFMGKQARIKEMYQQAVAESEQAITASSKKPDIDLDGAARSIKERFEKGEIFKDNTRTDPEDERDGRRAPVLHNEADVFESAISKKSRSIFMELDANVVAGKNQTERSAPITKQRSHSFNRHNSENEPDRHNDVVKCDEKAEDAKIETSELSSKFKFFETYRPSERLKKEFRITPPREGVVKMPTPDSDGEAQEDNERDNEDTNILEKSHTTAMMLSKFREMEQKKANDSRKQEGPRPLKAFTPPPDGGRRLYQEQDSDMDDDEEDDDDDDEEEEEDYKRRSHTHMNDEALKEAQAAARAKQLRAKFEKWEANEKQKEINEGGIDIYSDQVSDESNIESTKTIRERFENMENINRHVQPMRPRYKVNRFV